jgi:hypothetical protein
MTRNKSLENVANFESAVRTVTIKNSLHGYMKSRLHGRMIASIRAQSISSSSSLFKNIKIGIHRSIILPVVLYGFET